jgi:hypothetical protein
MYSNLVDPTKEFSKWLMESYKTLEQITLP